ncbi:MAG TPA: MFS transporter [Vicinamibacterales bacterium]|nr:MFS transporter [Vicinamibacterales bacterium]
MSTTAAATVATASAPSASAAAAPAAPASMTFKEVLGLDVMRRVWYAQVISLFGDFLALFAVIAVVSFRMHATPNQVTGVQIAYMLPIVFVGPVAGVFVDRWPLKPTLISSDLIRAVLCLLLIPSTQIWQVYIVLAALSCVSAFFGPAQTVTIRSHVPREGLVSANALMQVAFMGSRIVGPATAGAIVAAFGPAICYALDMVSFLASATLIASVVIQRPPSMPRPTESSRNRIHAIWIDMKAGMTFILHHGTILYAVFAMAAALMITGCFGPLIAIHVRDTLHASARSFGFVSGMIGVGLLVGTQIIRQLTDRASDSTLMLGGMAGIGAGVAVIGGVPAVAAALAGTFVIGFAFAAIMVPAQTLIQRETPHDMLGRVGSTNASIIFLGQVVGLAFSGVLAETIGVRMVFFLCAALAVGTAASGRVFLHTRSSS